MRTGVPPKRIATGKIKLFASYMAMRFVHTPPEMLLLPCFRHARTPDFGILRTPQLGRSSYVILQSFIVHCASTFTIPPEVLRMTPWQLDSNTTPTSSSLERR